MPETIFTKLKNNIPIKYRLAFIYAIIIGLMTHMYVFMNRLPNHDGLINIYSSQAKVTSGRFFLGPAAGISSFFDLPWVIGLFSIIFLALTAVCIIALFEVQKNISIVLISGIVVSFPSVSATFSYMFTADGYMLGTFLALLSVLLTKKYKYGFLIGSILLCLGVGIYQANLSVAMAFITLWLMVDILNQKSTLKQLGAKILQSALLVGIGMVIYYVVYKIYTSLFEVQMTTYQGLDKVGSLSFSDIPDRFTLIHEQLMTFFFRGIIEVPDSTNFLEMLNVLIFITLIVATIGTIIKKEVYKNIPQLILFVVLVITLPISFYIVYFLSPDVFYHILMVYSLSTVFIYLVLLYDRIDHIKVGVIERLTSWASVLLIAFTIYNFGLIANIAYMNMEMRYEKTVSISNRILDRIEQLEDYDDIKKIVTVGRPTMYSHLTSKVIPDKIPSMVGSSGEHFLGDVLHLQRVIENFLGTRIELAKTDEAEEIKQTTRFKEMGKWPAKDSVQVFDDTVVIKFTD
ncbi:hypothetical protein UACE39S_00774 [Ureibacillus acetophenoni]